MVEFLCIFEVSTIFGNFLNKNKSRKYITASTWRQQVNWGGPGQTWCNTPHVTFHICNSNSCHFRLCVMIFLRGRFLSFVLHFVHVMHLISCHHGHCISIRVRLMHPSIFLVVRFAIRRSHLLCRTPLVFFRERVSNVLGMDRGLPSGLVIPPVDHRSSFVPFGGRLVLQRLTG